MTIPEAIQELRRVSGKSLQVLSTELGIATKTLHLHLQGRTPEPRILLAMAAYADALNLDEPFKTFMDGLVPQLQPPPGWEVEISFRRTPPSSTPGTSSLKITRVTSHPVKESQ